MNSHALEILNLLLDKYERSSHFQGTSAINRKVKLSLNEYKQYDIEDVEKKKSIHTELGTLEKNELLHICWHRYQSGNIIDYVYLNLDNVDRAYIAAEREPKETLLNLRKKALVELNNRISVSWIRAFVDDMVEVIETKKTMPATLPNDVYTFQMLIDTLYGIDQQGGSELFERMFSRKYLGGSKVFEQIVRNKILSITKKYLSDILYQSDNDILESIGIIKAPEELLFTGPLEIKLGGKQINCSDFVYGASMNSKTIREFEFSNLNVSKVIIIENKSVYYEYQNVLNQEKTLLIYLGGFFSPIKQLFLSKLYEYSAMHNCNTEFYHWGDIDLGGFIIFTLLKQKAIPTLVPLYMDIGTLERHKDLCDSFDDVYAKKLERILDLEKYELFHPLLHYMLQHKVKLEQESLMVSKGFHPI